MKDFVGTFVDAFKKGGIIGILEIIKGYVALVVAILGAILKWGPKFSGMFRALLKIIDTSIGLIFKPIADAVAMVFLPIMLMLLKYLILPFNKMWAKLMSERGARYWGSVGGALGGIVGMAIGGPLGALAGMFLGSLLGMMINWLKNNFNKIIDYANNFLNNHPKLHGLLLIAKGMVKQQAGVVVMVLGLFVDAVLKFIDFVISPVLGVAGWIAQHIPGLEDVADVLNGLKERLNELANSNIYKYGLKMAKSGAESIKKGWGLVTGKIEEGVSVSSALWTSAFDSLNNLAIMIKNSSVKVMQSFVNVSMFNRLSGRVVSGGGASYMAHNKLMIFSRQVGGEIPETGLYLMHKGEVVVPSWRVSQLGKGISIESLNVEVNVHTEKMNEIDIQYVADEVARRIMYEIMAKGGAVWR